MIVEISIASHIASDVKKFAKENSAEGRMEATIERMLSPLSVAIGDSENSNRSSKDDDDLDFVDRMVLASLAFRQQRNKTAASALINGCSQTEPPKIPDFNGSKALFPIASPMAIRTVSHIRRTLPLTFVACLGAFQNRESRFAQSLFAESYSAINEFLFTRTTL